MLYCKNCKIQLQGKYARCPLCQGDLTGEADPSGNVFPAVLSHAQTYRRLLVWLALGSVVAAAVCIAVNLIVPSGGWWFLLVVGGILSFWISLALVLKKRMNLPKTILWQVGSLSLLAYFWDRCTGSQGWSLNYVLPILCTSTMVAMFVIAKIGKLEIQNYIFYLVVDCVFGILSFTLLAVGKITVVIPSAICFATTIISLAALFLFQGKALAAEMQRRFHL